ncbi:MAG TPA: phage holin family protein [Candidatus Limnocylindria bacterium]|nr:phage holin family protein [Candidatus Limnocylindria bacterium]
MVMATVHPLHPAAAPHDPSLIARLMRLLKLELELGVAETKQLVRVIVLSVAVAVPAAIALVAALIVLLAGAAAPLFDAAWQHLVLAGGVVLVLALAALAWSAWRLKHLQWPHQTLASFEENWQWLAAQLRSRLTLR